MSLDPQSNPRSRIRVGFRFRVSSFRVSGFGSPGHHSTLPTLQWHWLISSSAPGHACCSVIFAQTAEGRVDLSQADNPGVGSTRNFNVMTHFRYVFHFCCGNAKRFILCFLASDIKAEATKIRLLSAEHMDPCCGAEKSLSSASTLVLERA